jgi:hypothetical protein
MVMRNADGNGDPHSTTDYEITVAMPTPRYRSVVDERLDDSARNDSK